MMMIGIFLKKTYLQAIDINNPSLSIFSFVNMLLSGQLSTIIEIKVVSR